MIVPLPVKVGPLDEQCLTGKQVLGSKEACESVKQPEEPKVSPKKEAVPEKVDSLPKKSEPDSVNSTDRHIPRYKQYLSTPSQFM